MNLNNSNNHKYLEKNKLIQNITEKVLIHNKTDRKNKSKYLESNKILG